jgi:L-asparaginase
MKTLLVIHTGGTIAMKKDSTTQTVGIGPSNPLTESTGELSDSTHINVIEPFHKPSPHMTVTDMVYLKKIIEKECSEQDYDGVVITHGTDTLEETAFFLDLTVQVDVPVVLTGAMRSSNENGADGLRNFISAIRTAEEEQAKNKGVLVVFNDDIHTAIEVTKTHTTSVAAFQSPVAGPVGTITPHQILFHYNPLLQKKLPVQEMSKKVGLLKAYAGMDSSMFLALRDMAYDGIVIEALGQGNLPPGSIRGIEMLINSGCPVVVVSRCQSGFVYPTYDHQGGGSHLKDLGVIFCHGVNGQKARIKLMAALMNTEDRNELSRIMATHSSPSIEHSLKTASD